MRPMRAGVHAAIAAVCGLAGAAQGQILGQHHLTWWDDPLPVGVTVTLQGAAPPTPNSVQLFNMDEWHLNQATTANWYNGLAVAGLPSNPFNVANRNGVTAGSVITPVNNAEAFVYQITNINYFNGNGPPPNQAPPFSFTGPPGLGGMNDLSGINIMDSGGALQFSGVVGNSQFMASSNLAIGRILDLTPGSPGVPASQDWDFNAYTGAGNFEWDIDTAGIGASAALAPIVFGFAMPGFWQDQINLGHAHSWNLPAVGLPSQVNVTGPHLGFSGPVPSPGVLPVLAAAGLLFARRRRVGRS